MAKIMGERCCDSIPEIKIADGSVYLQCPVCGRKSISVPVVLNDDGKYETVCEEVTIRMIGLWNNAVGGE